MIGRVGCLVVSALVLLGAGDARAVPPGTCPALFVPEGYELTCEVSGDGAWRLSVRPQRDLLAPLSVLTLRPLEEPVEDPDIWLREQLTLNVSDVGVALSDLLVRPESPLYDPALADSLETMVGYLRVLDQMPLRNCGFPNMLERTGAWQIECRWEMGPIQLQSLLRLVERGDESYAVSIWALNPRRLRHLTAIANSF